MPVDPFPNAPRNEETVTDEITVWVALRRGAFVHESLPPGPTLFVGLFATRDEALEHCYPPGEDLWVREYVVSRGEVRGRLLGDSRRGR